MSFDKQQYVAPGNPPKGWIYKHCQDGWVLVPDNKGVHPDYNIDIAFASGILLILVLIVALIAASAYLP